MFEDKPHFVVADDVGMQVDAGELLRHQVQQVGSFQLGQPAVEGEVLEHLAGVGGELGDVVLEVGPGAGGADAGQGELRNVVEGGAGAGRQDQVHVHAAGFHRLVLAAHLVTGRLQHAFQAAQHGKGQDDAAKLGLFEVAAQHVGHVPDEVGEVLLVHVMFPKAGERRPTQGGSLMRGNFPVGAAS
ncbi:hypothetical protein D3C85_1341770 [compost metagenome]